MAIQQLSIFVENQPGKLLEKVKTISDAGIDLRAMCIAETRDFGILRIIVSDTQKAREVLSTDSIVTVTDVVAVHMEDKAGALYDIVKALADGGINVEYMYAFTAAADRGAYVVFRVNDNEQAEAVLAARGFTTLDADAVSAM